MECQGKKRELTYLIPPQQLDTPVSLAARLPDCHVERMRMLLDAGGDPNSVNSVRYNRFYFSAGLTNLT